MNSDSATTASCIDVLLAERAWLQRMAGALVRDGDAAQDLAQETWVTALTSPPRSVTRTWLNRVFRSRLCDDSRARHRRQLREQAFFETADERVATPEEITARMQLFRRVAEHMLALDEDVRQVLYLRYAEDLEPIEVARRLGIPGGTVRWRIKRGLDELRTRLDADVDRRRWVPLLAPWPSPGNRHRARELGRPRRCFWRPWLDCWRWDSTASESPPTRPWPASSRPAVPSQG